MNIGVCSKCGKKTNVVNHHILGYSESKKDFVVPYCMRCHTRAHNKAKREGRCGLDHKTVNRLSGNSYTRRTVKTLSLGSLNVGTNIQLRELLHLNLNTNNIVISSYFEVGYHTNIYTVKEVNNDRKL